MIGKEKLSFDPTDADTLDASDSVGAFVRAGSDGTLITSHNTDDTASVVFDTVTFTADNAGAIGNSIALVFNNADDLDTVVGAWNSGNPSNTVSFSGQAGTYVPSAGTAQLAGGLDERGLDVYFTNTSLPISATDLDIRDLVFATDKVDVSGSEVSLDSATLAALETITVEQGTSPWVIGDGGGSLTVDAVDLDIRDLAFATDSVDVSGSEVSLDATTLAALENITVSATDLDIRDLAFATDKVDVTGSEVSLDAATLAALETITVLQGTSPWVIGDGGGSITVDAVDLDIRDLSAASDSVQANMFDGAGNALTSSAGALDINIASSDIEIDVEDDKANTAILNTQKDVSTSSGALLASQQADRRFLYVQNLSNKNIFVGASGVSAANGIRMSSGAIAEFRLGPALSLHAVGLDSAQDIRLMELA